MGRLGIAAEPLFPVGQFDYGGDKGTTNSPAMTH